MNKLINANIELLLQLAQFLKSISENNYTTPQHAMMNSTIGMHTRHIVEFYTCFCEVSIVNQTRVVNYDLRKRDFNIEQSPLFTIEVIGTIIGNFEKMMVVDYPLIVETGVEAHQRSNHASSTSRELLYLVEHSTHHLAIIRMATLLFDKNFTFPTNFGFASSTVKSKVEKS